MLCLIESHIRFPFAFLLRSVNTKAVCECLLHVFLFVRIASMITSDNVTYFSSQLNDKFLELFGCKHGFSTALHTHTHTHTHPFNSPVSGTTRVSRYQKGKTNLGFTEARDSQWQWHQLGHMQVCTSLQTDNHASTPPLVFYRPDALPAAQPTASKH